MADGRPGEERFVGAVLIRRQIGVTDVSWYCSCVALETFSGRTEWSD